jgi:heat shock protein HtpX
MASLYTQAASNVRRTWALMAVFLVLVVLVGYAASLYFGNAAILYGSLIFALGTNVFAYWNSDKVAIASAGAVPADEDQYRELHRVVENLAITAGLPKPRVYIIDDPAPNAFATGRDKEHVDGMK